MTIAELKKVLGEYPDDQFVHVRIWMNHDDYDELVHKDVVVDKTQQGVDGALLITVTS